MVQLSNPIEICWDMLRVPIRIDNSRVTTEAIQVKGQNSPMDPSGAASTPNLRILLHPTGPTKWQRDLRRCQRGISMESEKPTPTTVALQNNVVTNWIAYTVTSPLLKHLGIDGDRMWTMLRYVPLLILSIFLVFIFQKWWGARGAVSNCCSVYIHKLLHFCAWVFPMSWVQTIKSLCTIHNIMESAILFLGLNNWNLATHLEANVNSWKCLWIWM